jgi:hypothetical protein
MAGVLKVNDGGAAWKNVVPPIPDPVIPNEVAISATQPSDPAVELWVDPNGTWASEYATKPYVDGTWNTATLKSGWVNYGAPWGSATRYRKVGPVVYITGLVANGTVAQGTGVIFTLPAGFRPSPDNLIFSVVGGNAFARLDIQPNGDVVANVGNNNYFSINVSFIADA